MFNFIKTFTVKYVKTVLILLLNNCNQIVLYRALTGDFAKLLEKGRELRWLFDFVLKHEELDFQIGKVVLNSGYLFIMVLPDSFQSGS